MNPASTILIVDDEPLGLATLEGLLRPIGSRILTASNGNEALSLALTYLPDIILLDVMMSGMDGFTLCRIMRSDPTLTEVPILLVTALDDQDSRLEGLSAGADDFISKPFDRVELRTRVQTITRLNRYRQLVHAREQFAWMVDHANDGYITLDQSDNILYANAQARRYLGLPIEGSLPACTTFFGMAQRHYHCEPQSAWNDWPISQDDGIPRYLVLPETPSTAAFLLHVEMCATPTDRNLGRIVRLHDVSSQVTFQSGIREFHAAVIHKLRTPLVGMTTSLELLENHAHTMPQESLSQIASIAADSVRRLRNEIDDVLQFINTPIVSSQNTGTAVTLLDGMVRDICRNLGILEVSVVNAETLHNRQFRITPRAIEMILWEICENSLKFHPGDQPAIDVITFQDKSSGVIQIRDNGISLTPEQCARAWSPYFQSEKMFTGQIPGMGLGLSLVAALVWSAGGHCNMNSRDDGPGMIIELSLPLTSNELVTPSVAPRSEVSVG